MGPVYDVTSCLAAGSHGPSGGGSLTETPSKYGKERAVRILLECIITVRNEVAKVMFLHLSVSHSVHRGEGGGLPQCMLGYHPLGADTPRTRHPLEQTPPGTRHLPEQTPPRDQTPSGTRHPPRTRHPSRTRHPRSPAADGCCCGR